MPGMLLPDNQTEGAMNDPIPFQQLIEDTRGLPQGVPVEHEILGSIAISLKRIADALNDPDPYTNPIAQALLNGISQGAQDWIGHLARSGR